jgi:hypothetical protein
MFMRVVTRRAATSDLVAFALLSAVAARTAFAQPAVRFREIRVDVSPLRASAGDLTADWVEQELPGALAHALATYLSPAERDGATLVARIRFVYLGPSGGTGHGGASEDSIEGVLIVRGTHGAVAAETPLRAIATYRPNASDQALVEEAYHERVVALAQAFAGWALRELGL